MTNDTPLKRSGSVPPTPQQLSSNDPASSLRGGVCAPTATGYRITPICLTPNYFCILTTGTARTHMISLSCSPMHTAYHILGGYTEGSCRQARAEASKSVFLWQQESCIIKGSEQCLASKHSEATNVFGQSCRNNISFQAS